MLTGTLDDFTLDDVLRLIAGARRTGGLAVTRSAGAGTLFFRDGAVGRAVPGYRRRTEAASPGRAIEDLAFDLMRWERGEFTWTPGAATHDGAEVTVDVDELLAAVSRRLSELAEIRTLVPSEDSILTMAPQPPEGAVQINISPAEWRVLVLVDGHRTVSDVADAAGLDELEAMKLLYGLAASGLVAADDTIPSGATSDMSDMSDTAREKVYEAPAPAPVFELDSIPAPEAEPDPAPEAEPDPDPAPALVTVADLPPVVAAAAAAAAAAADSAPVTDPGPVGEPNPFLDELAMEPASPLDSIPAAPGEPGELSGVDRSIAARELAGLFDEGNGRSTLGGAVVDPMHSIGGMAMAAPPAPPRVPRRVEDDDQVTRGLISRLIDGVKGL